MKLTHKVTVTARNGILRAISIEAVFRPWRQVSLPKEIIYIERAESLGLVPKELHIFKVGRSRRNQKMRPSSNVLVPEKPKERIPHKPREPPLAPHFLLNEIQIFEPLFC